MSGSKTVVRAVTRRWWLVAFLVATLWVWQRYAVVQAGHRIAEHRARLAHLIETRDALLADNTTLTARGRIESITATRLGLKPTRDNQIIRISRDNTVNGALQENSGAESQSAPTPAAQTGTEIASP
jgi:hypothetical protein